MKQEGILQGQLMAAFRASPLLALRHEDVRANGHPDISIHGRNCSSWAELKHATPGFLSRGIQEWILQQLEVRSKAWYVIYYEEEQIRLTLIVSPRVLASTIRPHGYRGSQLRITPSHTRIARAVFQGFDHQAVVNFYCGVHCV